MLSQIVQELKLEKRFSFFQLKNNQKHTAKKAQDGLQENLVNVQVCHSQNSSLTPIQHLGKKKKMMVHRYPTPHSMNGFAKNIGRTRLIEGIRKLVQILILHTKNPFTNPLLALPL